MFSVFVASINIRDYAHLSVINCSRSCSLCVAMDTPLFPRTAKMAVMFPFNQREPRHGRAPKSIVS